MLQPVAVLDHADRIVTPQPHPAQYDILAPFLTIPSRVDDVEVRKQRLGAGRAHIDEDEPAIFRHRVCRLPYVHRLAELRGFAWHVDALALRVVEPAVIAAAQPLLLDAAPFERRAAMRAMRVEGADPPLPVAEHDDLLAQQLFLPRKVAQFVRCADRLPVAAHQLAHRAARLDAGQLVIGRRGLPSVCRFHRVPPLCFEPQRKTLRFLSSRTLASSTIVRLLTFHAPFTLRSTSSRQPERSW